MKWVQRFIPLAPYTVLGIAGVILVWGIFAPNPGRFFLKPQFLVFIEIVFWITILSFGVKLIRKRGRDPSFFLLISNFIAIRGLLGLLFFSFAANQLDIKKQNVSKEVQDQLESHRKFWDEQSDRLHKNSQEIQDKVHKAFNELGTRMDSRLDRFMEGLRKDDKEIKVRIQKSEERGRQMREKFMKHATEAFEKRSNQIKRDWCKTHPLSCMCDNLPPEEPDTLETTPTQNQP